MAVALDQPLGSAQSTGTGAALPFTCVAAVPASEFVVMVGGGLATSAVASQAFTDSPTDSITSAAALIATAGGKSSAIEIAAAETAGLTTSSTITYTLSNQSFFGFGLFASSFTGLASNAATAKYATQTASGVASSATVTSGSVNAGDLVIVAFQCVETSAAAPTAPAGWSSLGSAIHNFSGAFVTTAAYYLIPGSTGTLSPAVSPGTPADGWVAAIVAFPALVSGSTGNRVRMIV